MVSPSLLTFGPPAPNDADVAHRFQHLPLLNTLQIRVSVMPDEFGRLDKTGDGRRALSSGKGPCEQPVPTLCRPGPRPAPPIRLADAPAAAKPVAPLARTSLLEYAYKHLKATAGSLWQ